MLRRYPALIHALIVLLLAGLSGCDAVYRLLQKEGAEERDLLGEVNPLESNPKVAEVQKLLKLYGYRVGSVDGVLGVNTREAIEDFQEDNDLKISRFVDNATWAQLNVFSPCGLVVDGELNVSALQQAMSNAGIKIKVDGKMGPATEAAVKDFQKARGLEVDGRVGYQTLTELARYLPVVSQP